MSNRVTINKEVTVTAMYFRGQRQLKSFPKRMEYNGREYTFVESGLRYLVQKGQQFVQIFDMADDRGANYRLKFDDQAHLWTLVNIAEAPRVFG